MVDIGSTSIKQGFGSRFRSLAGRRFARELKLMYAAIHERLPAPV